VADTERDGDDMGSVVAEAVPEVLEPGARSVSELAEKATHEHGLVLEAGATMMGHAINAGEALLALKPQIAAGTWRQWIGANLPFTYATAHLYMRCFKHQDLIREHGWTRMNEVKIGLGALVEPDHEAKGRNGRARPEWMKELAREMYGEEGATYAAIARELGASPSAVRCWVDPRYKAISRQKVAAINKRRIRAERLLREQERDAAIKRAVKKAGAATKEAWAMAERMQDVLAQAQRETEDREARRALSEAGAHYRRMRDEIVRALGVS
jgi:transposase-like protein